MQHHSKSATDQRSGKRKSISKRNLPEQGESSQHQHHHPSHQQTTISDLLQNPNSSQTHRTSSPTETPTNPSKRPRLSSASSSSRPGRHELIAPDKMYNFTNNNTNNENSRHAPPGQTSASESNMMKPGGLARPRNFTPHSGAKRLVVKNLRTTGPRLNQDSYFEKVWVQLDAALASIFQGGKPEMSLEELYKGSENVCRQGRAAVLAKSLQVKCREHVAGRLREVLVARTRGRSDVETIRAVVDAWNTWQSKLVCLVDYFL